MGYEPIKSWMRSRTVWLMLVTGLVAILAEPSVLAVVPLEWMPYITALVSVLGIILRFKTSEPVGK